jgi:hypothetical protein
MKAFSVRKVGRQLVTTTATLAQVQHMAFELEAVTKLASFAVNISSKHLLVLLEFVVHVHKVNIT